MCLKNYSNLITNIYSYLGFKGIEKSDELENIIKESLDEVIKLTRFKALYQEFDYLIDCLNKEPYKSFLNGTSGYYLTCYTLGVDVEKKIKLLSKSNLTKMVIMDACASAYLEYLSDDFDKNLNENLTYRFCPGYQGSSISDLKEIADLLNIKKIGIDLLESNIMVPQKSMIGIIGIGKSIKKECGNCMLKGKCEFIKEGKRCYKD